MSIFVKIEGSNVNLSFIIFLSISGNSKSKLSKFPQLNLGFITWHSLNSISSFEYGPEKVAKFFFNRTFLKLEFMILPFIAMMKIKYFSNS